MLAVWLIALKTSLVWAEPVEVSVTFPTATKHYQSLLLTGTVESAQDAFLAPLESGVVAKLFVEVGDKVEEGQPLLALDDKLARLGERQALADFKAAEVTLSEAKRLYQEVDELSKRQLAAKTLLAQRMASVTSAEAELSRLQASLDLQREILNRHVLKAPFAGVVYQRAVDVGEWITPATGVLAIVAQQNSRLSVEVPQEYYATLSQFDGPIKVITNSSKQAIVMGHLDRLVAVTNSQTRSFTAHIGLPTETPLLIGMSAQAEIELPETGQTALWLPASTIKQHPDGGVSIFAVENLRAKRVLVKILQQRGEAVLVTNAQANQMYVSTGVDRLRDNAEIKIKNQPPAP